MEKEEVGGATNLVVVGIKCEGVPEVLKGLLIFPQLEHTNKGCAFQLSAKSFVTQKENVTVVLL